MILLRHVARLIVETTRFGFTSRRLTLVVVVVIGLVLAALVVVAQVTAPLAVYPFA